VKVLSAVASSVTRDWMVMTPNKRINTTRRSASPLRGVRYWRARYAQHVRHNQDRLNPAAVLRFPGGPVGRERLRIELT